MKNKWEQAEVLCRWACDKYNKGARLKPPVDGIDIFSGVLVAFEMLLGTKGTDPYERQVLRAPNGLVTQSFMKYTVVASYRRGAYAKIPSTSSTWLA